MRAIGVIAGLTVREAIRRKLFVASLLIAVLFFLVSLLPYFMGMSEAEVGPRHARMALAEMLTVFFGLPMLRFFSAIQAVILGTMSLSGEIERGSLLVVLPKPLPRSHIVLGKWIGINGIVGVSVVLWALLLWASLFIQLGRPNTELLRAGTLIVLYPVVFSSLALMFSTFTSPILAASLTLICGGIAWSEAILKFIGRIPFVDMPLLVRLGELCSYVVPMAHIDRWVERVLGPLSAPILALKMSRGPVELASRADLVYIAVYTIVTLALGLFIFQRRDI